MTALATRIAQKRQREGLSLRDAGTAAGVAFSTLGRIENGATPSYGVGQRIEAWLRGEAPVLPPPPMTLRDWFAGQALASLRRHHTGHEEWFAAESYRQADAMLAERATSPTPELTGKLVLTKEGES